MSGLRFPENTARAFDLRRAVRVARVVLRRRVLLAAERRLRNRRLFDRGLPLQLRSAGVAAKNGG